MNQRKSSFHKNQFRGACSKCGEVYEAQSVTDDLSGVNFKCKKSMCEGRVSLEAVLTDIQIREGQKDLTTPRRFS